MVDTIFLGLIIIALALIPTGIVLLVLSRKKPENRSFLSTIGLSLLILGILAAFAIAFILFIVVYTFSPLLND